MSHYLPGGEIRLPAPPRPNKKRREQGRKAVETITINTADLSGAALDWAVAKVEGVNAIMFSPRKSEPRKPLALFGSLALSIGGDDENYSYSPSRCWHCGGPLIERHDVWLSSEAIPGPWLASINGCGLETGPTPLIAACRAIVYRVLGDTVDVPAELVETPP